MYIHFHCSCIILSKFKLHYLFHCFKGTANKKKEKAKCIQLFYEAKSTITMNEIFSQNTPKFSECSKKRKWKEKELSVGSYCAQYFSKDSKAPSGVGKATRMLGRDCWSSHNWRCFKTA